MSNTLTNLIPDVYAALNVVSRELTGFIPSVMRDPSADRAAVGQTLRIAQAPAASGRDITPAMSLPSASDQTFTNKTFTITKSRAFPFSWSGSEQVAMNTGPGYLTLKQNQIAEAIRAAVNEIENDIFTAAYKASSRAYGTAGTTPFASTLGDPAQLRKILDDNGAPNQDRSLVIDTTAGAAVRTLAQLTKANEAGGTDLLRQGTLLDIHGFMLRESSKVAQVTKGTGASYLVNNASGYAIGATTIAADTGSGTILAGDVVTFNGDTNKYIVVTALSGGSFEIAAPGLLKALADNTAITVGNSYTPNVGFSRSAIVLGTRMPDLPAEGDLAIERTEVMDERTGLVFEVAAYPGYRMVTYELGISWGVSVIKPAHVATLLG